ncbi:MAG: hypothetical protein ACKOES_14150 [Planctomycetaceae bacterium]
MTAIVALVGCARRGPPTYPVAGTVRLDGMPVERGLIRLVPPGAAAPVGAEITSGAYALLAPPGEARVEITAAKVVGRRQAYDAPDSPLVDITAEAVPEKYNISSTLTLDVRAGDNRKDFDLVTR